MAIPWGQHGTEEQDHSEQVRKTDIIQILLLMRTALADSEPG